MKYFNVVFQNLLKGQDNWSLSELVQAIVILVHTHSLCSFVYGCGITPEIDFDRGHTYKTQPLSEFNKAIIEGVNLPVNGVDNQSSVKYLVEKMKEAEAKQDTLLETTQEELFQQFEKVESGEGRRRCFVGKLLLHVVINEVKPIHGLTSLWIVLVLVIFNVPLLLLYTYPILSFASNLEQTKVLKHRQNCQSLNFYQ